MLSDNNDCNCTDPCADILDGQPTKCEKCSNRMKAGWVAGIPAPPSVAVDLKNERELQAKRVKANQAASIAGLKMAAAAAGPLAGGMAAPIGTATNLVARNAVALVMAMTLSVWHLLVCTMAIRWEPSIYMHDPIRRKKKTNVIEIETKR